MRYHLLPIILLLSLHTTAQDNNMLAKIAFENAEISLNAGNTEEALSELLLVDKYLSKLSPKSQYLRVQIWSAATDKNFSFVDSAIKEGKSYLALAKKHDLPEDKVMDVTRLIVKLEKDKKISDEKIYARKRIGIVVDSLFEAFKVKLGSTEEEFRLYNPNAFDGLTRYRKKNAPDRFYTNENKLTTGPEAIMFNNGRVQWFNYRLYVGNKADEAKKMFYIFKALFPKNLNSDYAAYGNIISNDREVETITISGTPKDGSWVRSVNGTWSVLIHYSNIKNATSTVLLLFFRQ